MELEEAIEKINEIRKEYDRFDGLTEYVEAIDFVIKHLIEQEKMIDLMAEYLEDELNDDICNKENCYADEYINGHCKKCLNCIKQYFEKKVEESE